MDLKEIKEKVGKRLEKVKSRIFILSNKGGVGKTAVSVPAVKNRLANYSQKSEKSKKC